jgi:hypothetical protein
MKIPARFKKIKEDSLIIVAGKQAAVIYDVRDGYMSRLNAFKIPRPRYSDNEGQFRSKNKSGTVRAGSTREFQDEDVIKEFLKEFKKRIKLLSNKWESVYILAPDKTKNRIPKDLPDQLQRKLKAVIEGNFYYRSPVYILEKIENAPKEDYKDTLMKGKKKGRVK